MERTITMNLEPDTMIAMAEIAGNAELFKAIGYLSQWNMNMGDVRLVGGVYDGNPEIIATYWRDYKNDQTIAYQIGAVWHGDHFGFHS